MEFVKTYDQVSGSIGRGSADTEGVNAGGRYEAVCHDLYGNEKWRDFIDNLVTTEGKNMLLDNLLSTNVTPNWFIGLISSVSYSAVAATDVAAQINGTNGWKEAGSSTNFPLFTARLAPSWSAASGGSKATSAAVVFTIGATGGTVKGCFLIGGSGAVSTLASTAGKLYSAGLFSGGDKVLSTGDTLSVSYTASA